MISPKILAFSAFCGIIVIIIAMNILQSVLFMFYLQLSKFTVKTLFPTPQVWETKKDIKIFVCCFKMLICVFHKKLKGKRVKIMHELVTVIAECGAFYVTEKSGRLLRMMMHKSGNLPPVVQKRKFQVTRY